MASPNLSELVSTTLRLYLQGGTLADNVSQGNIFLFMMRRRGNLLREDGGTDIVLPLEYAEGVFQRYSGGQVLDVSGADVLTSATANWMQAAALATFSGRERRINASGKTRVVNFVTAKVKNAIKTLENNIGDDLYSDGSASNQIGGLQHLVPDDPTASSTVLGINQSTNTWWRSKIVDLSTESITISKSTIRQAMILLYLRTSRGNDHPDLVLAGDTYGGYYEESLQDLQRFSDTKMAEAGFETLKFKGASVFFDSRSTLSATRMYFLNTEYMKFVTHKDADFEVGDTLKPSNQDAETVPIWFMGNLVCTNRSLQGVMIA